MARIHYDVPDEVHRRAKTAAAMRGITLKDFLIEALEAAADDVIKRDKDKKPRR